VTTSPMQSGIANPYGEAMTLFQSFRRLASPGCVAITLGSVLFATPSTAEPIRIVMLGDSLTAGYGLPPGQELPVRLEAALQARGHEAVIENAGVSGDTAQGGLARLDWSVPEETDAVIIALGANDVLRGIKPEVTRSALTQIIERLKARRIQVMLAGMLAPRNYGPGFAKAFDSIFPDLARTYDLVYYPFILDGVALDAALNQPDGIHPNAKGVSAMAERMVPVVEELLVRIRGH